MRWWISILEIDDESITSEDEEDMSMEESTDRQPSSKETDKQKADALKQQICEFSRLTAGDWSIHEPIAAFLPRLPGRLFSIRMFSLLALWDSFLELRIKLQRATITCNCLPTAAVDDDQELREVMDESKRADNAQFFHRSSWSYSISDATLFRKTLALLLAIDKRRAKKRSRDDDDDEESETNTTDLFKTISKRLKHDQHTIDHELTAAYESFVPER